MHASQTNLAEPAPAADPTTKDLILFAAEELFAAEGFEKVSLRAITQAAEVNLASVNYHFGSKDALIDAVIENIVTPINRERLHRLDSLESELAPDSAIATRDILDAFLRPLVVAIKESDLSEEMFFRLMGRCMAEPDYRMPESLIPQFQEVVQRFSDAAARALPKLPHDLIVWRLYFSIGTLVQSLMHIEALDSFSGGKSGQPSLDDLLTRIIDYCIGGFEAPVSENK
ncbi:MAG: TetR/AcrR family transcriptional regulator [Verrucomicrobiota bacterium]